MGKKPRRPVTLARSTATRAHTERENKEEKKKSLTHAQRLVRLDVEAVREVTGFLKKHF